MKTRDDLRVGRRVARRAVRHCVLSRSGRRRAVRLHKRRRRVAMHAHGRRRDIVLVRVARVADAVLSVARVMRVRQARHCEAARARSSRQARRCGRRHQGQQREQQQRHLERGRRHPRLGGRGPRAAATTDCGTREKKRTSNSRNVGKVFFSSWSATRRLFRIPASLPTRTGRVRSSLIARRGGAEARGFCAADEEQNLRCVTVAKAARRQQPSTGGVCRSRCCSRCWCLCCFCAGRVCARPPTTRRRRRRRSA